MEPLATTSKRAGRRARLAKRTGRPEVNPCPPGQISGFHKPLTDSELPDNYDIALRLLAELGMGDRL